MKKRALLTGIGGMDGSHLAEFLLSKDYEVFGCVKAESVGTDTAGRKKADVVEEAEIMYMADHLEEAIDEGIANLQ